MYKIIDNDEFENSSNGITSTVHIIAASQKLTELFPNILKSFPCYLNSQDENGYTPLHLAARRKHYAIVELLIIKECKPYYL